MLCHTNNGHSATPMAPSNNPRGKKILNGSVTQSAEDFRASIAAAAPCIEQSLPTPKMDRPTDAELAFNAGLKTFTAKFLDKRRREKRRNDRKSFVGSERIHRLTNFRKRLNPFREDRTNVQCLKFASRHCHYSSQFFRRSPASMTSVSDHSPAIIINQTLACPIHQLARGVLFAASAGICWRANSALIRNESSGLSISSATHKSGRV